MHHVSRTRLGPRPARPSLDAGTRVSIACSTGASLLGRFTRPTRYADGTPAAEIKLDRGAIVVAPLADLKVIR